jgi:hypothetical protein
MANPFRSAAEIIDESLLEQHQLNSQVSLPSKRETLIRVTNRARQQHRPLQPEDLNFEVMINLY